MCDNDIDNDFLYVTLNIINQVNVLNVLRKKDFKILIPKSDKLLLEYNGKVNTFSNKQGLGKYVFSILPMQKITT